MFTSQTSSFQDSIDVEEKDDFDSEEIAGYSQKASAENVAWNQRRADSTTSQDDFSIPEEAVGCYCCLLEQERSPEQPDADGNGYLQNLETEVRPYLSRWYEESVMHIYRVVQLVQGNISFLLHAALSHTHVDVTNSDERTKVDVSRFIKAASLQGLSQQDTTTASLCKAISEDTQSDLIIDCSTSPPTLSNTVSNRFCDDWIQAFLNAAERCNPFLLRQILENFKLKAIQDMNSLKRFVRQAEMSHYALFRCCQFLQGCGNGDVLLQNARAEHSDLPEACSIITVLEEFLREQSQAQA
ncbi:hypothetical protein INR49_011176 [Caranx melampygus]|nr:hypothetical protein INR49_011176 [Caranx melampygus]